MCRCRPIKRSCGLPWRRTGSSSPCSGKRALGRYHSWLVGLLAWAAHHCRGRPAPLCIGQVLQHCFEGWRLCLDVHIPAQVPTAPPSPCRELYSEKRVVLEERRLRVDNSPLGPFSEAFALASLSNNYR